MIKSKNNRPVRRIEYWLVITSVILMSTCYYGLRALAVYGLAAVTAVLTDFICLFLRNRPYRLIDLSNIANALILVMLFPATVPYSIVILSTVFAVAVGTHVFGYRKDYLLPPSAVGYLFALLCWRSEILQFPQPGEKLSLFGNQAALHSITDPLYQNDADFLELLLGTVSTPMGTGCLLLLAVGAVVLLLRKQLDAWAAIGYILGIEIEAFFMLLPTERMLTLNMLLFCMVFMIADPSLMPCRRLLACLGAACTGLLTVYLFGKYRLEYAPIVAVMLTCPLWRGLAALGQKTSKTTIVSAHEEGVSDEA